MNVAFNITLHCFKGKSESWAPGTAEGCPVWRLCAKHIWQDVVKRTRWACVQAMCKIAAWSKGKWTMSQYAHSCSCASIKAIHPSNTMQCIHSNVICLSLKHNPKFHIQQLPLTLKPESSPGRSDRLQQICICKSPAPPEALLEPWSCSEAGPKSPQQSQPTALFGK